jgi:two-component system cell cycle response regulator
VTVVAIALGVVVAVLLLALVLLLVSVRRLRRASDERVNSAVGDLNARMDAMVAELQGALRRADDESRRNRFMSELGSSLDLDDVLGRVLDAAVAATSADAALLALDDPSGPPLLATVGLASEDAGKGTIAGPPDGREARSITVTYRYSDEDLAAGADLIHGGVAVPVGPAEGRLGMLATFTREPGREAPEQAVEELEELARRAGPAVDNARRFREARQLADLDALTGLHNRRYFHETLAREVARAQRYQRTLTLIVLDLDDFKEINDRIGHLGGDAVLAEAAERVRSVVRSADIACRVGGDEFAVIAPESGTDQGRLLVSRIQRAISDKPIGPAGRVRLSAGVAELLPEDDAVSLFERADAQLYAAKQNGKGGVSVAEPA